MTTLLIFFCQKSQIFPLKNRNCFQIIDFLFGKNYSECSSGHVEGSFDNPAEIFFAPIPKYFQSKSEEKSYFSESFRIFLLTKLRRFRRMQF